MKPRYRTTPIECRFGAVFVVLYQHTTDAHGRFIARNVIGGRHIGYAVAFGQWTLSVGRHV